MYLSIFLHIEGTLLPVECLAKIRTSKILQIMTVNDHSDVRVFFIIMSVSSSSLSVCLSVCLSLSVSLSYSFTLCQVNMVLNVHINHKTY